MKPTWDPHSGAKSSSSNPLLCSSQRFCRGCWFPQGWQRRGQEMGPVGRTGVDARPLLGAMGNTPGLWSEGAASSQGTDKWVGATSLCRSPSAAVLPWEYWKWGGLAMPPQPPPHTHTHAQHHSPSYRPAMPTASQTLQNINWYWSLLAQAVPHPPRGHGRKPMSMSRLGCPGSESPAQSQPCLARLCPEQLG